MQNEIHGPKDHTWTCRQAETSMGEVERVKVLSPAQVELINRDHAKVEEVCPGGAVVCSTCDVPFDGVTPEVVLPNFGELDRRLPDPS